MDIVRIALGIFLCYKGVDFLNNMSQLISLMTSNKYPTSFWFMLAGHYTYLLISPVVSVLRWVYLPAWLYYPDPDIAGSCIFCKYK
jgi:hypothetical protein